MADLTSVVSAVAAVVSAVGGTFATVAAFRSAGSALKSQEAVEASEKRFALRQLMVTASKVLVEAKRAESRGAALKLSYSTLFTFAGGSGSGLQAHHLVEIDSKLAEIAKLSEYATPFVSGQDVLMNGPLDEISCREIKVAQVLTQVTAIREESGARACFC
jgi:hypothetical protein